MNNMRSAQLLISQYFFCSSELWTEMWSLTGQPKVTSQAFIWLIILVLNSSQLVGMVQFTSQDACQGYLKIIFCVEYQWLQYSRHESAGIHQQDQNKNSINDHFTLIRYLVVCWKTPRTEVCPDWQCNVPPVEIGDQLVSSDFTSVDWLTLPPRHQQ